jgi:hypothetical protein
MVSHGGAIQMNGDCAIRAREPGDAGIAGIPNVKKGYEVSFGLLKGETGDSQQHRCNVFCFWYSHLFSS